MSDIEPPRLKAARKSGRRSLYLASAGMSALFLGTAMAQSMMPADLPALEIPDTAALVAEAAPPPAAGLANMPDSAPTDAAATAAATEGEQAMPEQAAAVAEEEVDPGLATLRRLAQKIDGEPVAEQAAAPNGAASERSLPEEMDPFTARDVRRLDREGVLDRQKRVGEDILVMEREIARADQVGKLIETLGHEGFREAFPEIYASLQDSPLILTSKIKYHELQHELEKAIEGPREEETPAADAETVAGPRDDGSSFFALPQPSGPAPLQLAAGNGAAPTMPIPDQLIPAVPPSTLILSLGEGEAATAGEDAAVLEPAPEPFAPISLREIYGLGSDYQAIITLGDERVRIFAGDKLPDGTEIRAIGKDHVIIIRDEQEIRLGIRG